MLTATAKSALEQAYATKGPHRGQLLARCPRSHTLAAAAWQAAQMVCNPYKVGIATLLFMNDAQCEVYAEVLAHFEALPREYQILADRDREVLSSLGVW